jgi:hypothetical protein
MSVANVSLAETYTLTVYTRLRAGNGSNQFYRVQGTFGQADSGIRASGSYTVGSGFWESLRPPRLTSGSSVQRKMGRSRQLEPGRAGAKPMDLHHKRWSQVG